MTRQDISIGRRKTLLGLGGLLAGAGSAAFAQNFPARPVTMVVPYPPGGGFDAIARPFAEHLGKHLGQQVVVENRPGNAGNMGTDHVARAQPNGYTLLFANDYLASNPSASRNVRYDPVKDFAPIGMIATTQVVIAVRPDFPANNFAELVALSNKKALSYGTPGAGTSVHLVGEYLSSVSPLKSLHIPYKGTGPAVTDTIGGQIDMVYATTPSVASHIQAGKLRGIAVFGADRSANLPDVPTLKEIGGPPVNYEVWYSLMAPSGTPPTVLATLRSATQKALDPDLAIRLSKLGYVVKNGAPEEVTRMIQDGLDRWREVVAKAKISID